MIKANILKVLATALLAQTVMAGPVGVVPGRILMKEKAGMSEDAVKQTLAGHGARQSDRISHSGVRILDVPEPAREKVMAALKHNPTIQFAEPDFILAPDATVNDPYSGSQWHLSKIMAPAAWDLTMGSSSVTIAILDTGVESSHPDLAGKLVAGWNFYNNTADTSDTHGHGTAVAGTAAAKANNGVGVASVALNCAIMPIRISDPQGYALDSTIAKALNWAADRGVRVANISFGASTSTTVATAAQYFQSKGGVVIVSSGNDGTYSSVADNPYLLVVGATDSNDALATWSNTGNHVDISAPGVNIYTTSTSASYGYWSGTSFSAPVVAGAAALVISANPSLTGLQASQILENNADDRGTVGWDNQFGMGRVNVHRAVSAARATQPVIVPPPTTTLDTTAPTIRITSPTEAGRIGVTTYVYVAAADNKAVTKVDLYVDGQFTASTSTAPFTTRWNSRKATSGAHRLQTRAYDAAGNATWSTAVTVYR